MLPPCKLFGLRGHGLGVCRLYGRAKGDLQKDLCHRMPPRTAAANAPVPTAGPSTHTSTGDPQTEPDLSVGVYFGSLFFPPGSWCAYGFVSVLQESLFPPVLCKFCNQISLASKVKLSGGFQSLCQISRVGNLLWVLELFLTVREFLWYNCSAVCGSSS